MYSSKINYSVMDELVSNTAGLQTQRSGGLPLGISFSKEYTWTTY
jgi:hypothetical protein